MKRDERRAEIVNAAVALIDRLGIQGLTTKNLAAAVGVTEPALYRHFGSKYDILAAVVENFTRSVRATIDEVEGAGLTPAERIGAVYDRNLSRFAGHPAIAAVIFSEDIFQNDRRLARRVHAFMTMMHDWLVETIRQGQRRGTIVAGRPPHQLAVIVMGAFRFLVVRWRLGGHGFDLEAEGRQLWKTLSSLITSGTGNS